MTETDEIEADVLVLGGGPAGCWAALTAREAGARVVLAEKGYVGTGGPTAAGNSSIVDTAPGSAERHKAVEQRLKRGVGLADGGLVDGVYDEVHRQLNRMADWGYDFPCNDEGQIWRGSMRGADYLRFMRQRLLKGRVTVMDHSPALALLTADGVVAGAEGVARQTGRRWRVRAGAVVMATGGCAFLSGALGTNGATGDGYLMAAEVGSRFSGMEFTGQYGIAPKGSAVTKGIIYYWATFFDEHGNVIPSTGDRQETVAKGLASGGRVFARLDQASARVQSGMRGQANVFLPFDRQQIDPFSDVFEVELLHEGTVRGTGGILSGEGMTTDIPGLYVAGDAAARDRMAGATSGGGGPNASWAMATGSWAGRSAAHFTRALGPRVTARHTVSADRAGRGAAQVNTDLSALRRAMQEEVLPLDRSFQRDAGGILSASERLEHLWAEAQATDGDPLRRRELLAMLLTARLMFASAATRTETRGISRRADHPATDPAQARPILSFGLEEVAALPQRQPVIERLRA